MSTYRETLARLKELASLAIPGPYILRREVDNGDYILLITNPNHTEVASQNGQYHFRHIYRSVDWRSYNVASLELMVEANPAVILALVQQVEEMRKALEWYADKDKKVNFAGMGPYPLGKVAREALAALDKEIE